MIHGFPAQPSVHPGDELTLHVSTDAPAFRVEVYRWTDHMQPVTRSGWFEGHHAPYHLPFQDWSEPGTGLHGEPLEPWPAYRLAVGDDWPSAAYIAVLVEGDGRGEATTSPDVTTPDARSARALFVVRPRRPSARILYKVPLFTYFAYDHVPANEYDPATQQGAWCFYSQPRADRVPIDFPPSLSLRRPGGGTGGTPCDIGNFDPFDPTPRQTFAKWDAPFLAWLARRGHAVDVCTDLDLHRDLGPDDLAGYRLLVSVGHDEYWSDVMRDKAEAYARGGGNIAFFGANTCWWRIAFDDDPCLRYRRTAFWSDVGPEGPDRPENSLTGVSFRNGGERDRDDHPVPVGFRVQHADHWAYEGTGLRDGDVFGDGPEEYIVGYECDGAAFDRTDPGRGGGAVRPTGEDGTPPDFTILGVGDLASSSWGFGNRAATMGLHTPGGTVFTAATTDWARVLAAGTCPPVERITRNVVERLSR